MTEATQQQQQHTLLLGPPSHSPIPLSRSSESTELSFLCYTVASHWLCYTWQYIYIYVGCLMMAEQKDVHSCSPARTPKLQLAAKQPSTGERCIPPKKIPRIQGQRRSPNKMVGGVKLHSESNPMHARDARKAQTQPCVHQNPETSQRLSQTCL